MRLNFQLLVLLCMVTITTSGQEAQSPSLNIGDPVPPLRLRAWIKGTPVERFEKGKVYVVELWATWCAPCRKELPMLEGIQRVAKDRVRVVAVNIEERAKFHYYLAKMYAKSGRNDMAMQYVRKALEEGFKDKKKLEEDPEFQALRDLPEFKDLLTAEPRVL